MDKFIATDKRLTKMGLKSGRLFQVVEICDWKGLVDSLLVLGCPLKIVLNYCHVLF